MVQLYIYIDGVAKEIELFDDEKISITSSIQNINDISKVFTDYSQSFTIPASANNNIIFKHWYESGLDNGYDQRIRYEGFIKIDTQTFRTGKWQLESASIKDNRVEDYKLTFYGNLKSLADKFGEDKLKDIQEVNEYTINYSGANVQDTITTTADLDLMYPLISSARSWQYGAGGSNDISVSANAIVHTELFPALKVSKIFEAIASKYNLTFSGGFLNDARFKNAFLWLKNKEENTVNFSEEVPINFNTIVNNSAMTQFTSSQFTINKQPFFTSISGSQETNTFSYFQINLTLSTATNWELLLYKSGTLYASETGYGTSISKLYNANMIDDGTFAYKIKSTVPVTITGTATARHIRRRITSPYTVTDVFSTANISASISSIPLDLTRFMPDMKVSDFFTGILKMFNLTAFSEDGENFTLQQLEQWYYEGEIKDFSQYCITDKDINRVKPYKKIKFEYEKSESILNKKFFDLFSREYGNLDYSFNYDGSEYTIKLPFENILFNKFTATNLQVAYALKSDLNKYIPKPVIIYRNERKGCSFYFNNGSTTNLISMYNVFGQELYANGVINSLNWGVEISSFYLNPIYNSLFKNYYLDYLSNLYSLKSRMIKIKMRLPYTELLRLKLNDRIVIRNKRYLINQYTTDLTTFESDFELIEDFRNINFNNSADRYIDNTAQTLTYYYTQQRTWSIEADPLNIIESFTQYDGYIEVNIKDNTSGEQRVCILSTVEKEQLIIIQDA